MGRKRSSEARGEPRLKASRLPVPVSPGHVTLRVEKHAKAVRDAFGSNSKGLSVPGTYCILRADKNVHGTNIKSVRSLSDGRGKINNYM